MRAAIVGLLVAVVALLGVVVYLLLPEGVDEEREAAREDFETVAEIYCTLGYSGSINDPEFKECVENQVDSKLERWENADRPDPSTIR